MQEAIDKFCSFSKGKVTLEQLSNRFLVEQHKDDLARAHVYFYVSSNKKVENRSKFGIEIKGFGTLLFCSPSVHKNGERYEFFRNEVFSPEISNELLEHVERIVSVSEGSEVNEGYGEKFPLPNEGKLRKGVRHNTLLYHGAKLASDLYNSADENLIFMNLIHINKTKFEEPFDEKEVKRIARDTFNFVDCKRKEEADILNFVERYENENATVKKEKENDKRIFQVNKYSANGMTDLHESIILNGIPLLLYYDAGLGRVITRNEIEEATRILKPPNSEEYAHIPYKFENLEELNEYVEKVKHITMGELYDKCRSLWQLYVDQDNLIITLLTADTIFTYFQDLFSVTHYTEPIGAPDTGKSSAGYVMYSIGYRAVMAGAISSANYYRMLKNIEPGQCVIIEDEGDDISEDPEKIRIIKLGYELEKKIPKTNMNLRSQDQAMFYIYCYKMIIAERSIKEWKAKGLVDRTFTLNFKPGEPRHSIKDVVSNRINKSEEDMKLQRELDDFRKQMLCFRLVHCKDRLPELKTNLRNRDKELTYPILQLFYGSPSSCFQEIRKCLEHFIEQRHGRKRKSLEAALFLVLEGLIVKNAKIEGNEYIANLKTKQIWEEIIKGTKIKGIEPYSNTFVADEFGQLHRNSIIKLICDTFSATLKHKEDGNVLEFKVKTFESFKERYALENEGFRIILN